MVCRTATAWILDGVSSLFHSIPASSRRVKPELKESLHPGFKFQDDRKGLHRR